MNWKTLGIRFFLGVCIRSGALVDVAVVVRMLVLFLGDGPVDSGVLL